MLGQILVIGAAMQGAAQEYCPGVVKCYPVQVPCRASRSRITSRVNDTIEVILQNQGLEMTRSHPGIILSFLARRAGAKLNDGKYFVRIDLDDVPLNYVAGSSCEVTLQSLFVLPGKAALDSTALAVRTALRGKISG